MRLDESDIKQLEDYWNELLPPDQLTALEQRLASDPTFARLASEWKIIITEGINRPQEEELEYLEIKRRLRAIDDEASSSNKGKFVKIIYLLPIAAVILLLVWLKPLSSIWGARKPSGTYLTHLNRDNANLSTQGASGVLLYDQKKYKAAYPKLIEQVRLDEDSLNLIYAAVAAIHIGKGGEAIELLEPMLNAKKWEYYQNDIQWYLALAYWDEKQKDKAKVLLELILKEDEAYQTQAQNILDQLDFIQK